MKTKLFALLSCLGLALGLAATPSTASAGWDWQAPAAAHQGWDWQTPAAVAPPAHVGPTYNDAFWYPGPGNVISLCVNNRSSFAFQTAVQDWAAATNINLYYEPGPGGCDTWALNHRIDIRDGSDAHCVYWFAQASGGFNTRMIMYTSTAPSMATCWSSQIRKNHYSSKGMGVTLGLQVFHNTSSDLHVMNDTSVDSISWPQGPDITTLGLLYS